MQLWPGYSIQLPNPFRAGHPPSDIEIGNFKAVAVSTPAADSAHRDFIQCECRCCKASVFDYAGGSRSPPGVSNADLPKLFDPFFRTSGMTVAW